MSDHSPTRKTSLRHLMQSQPIGGILFDKDGTLIDFNATWVPVYKQAAEYLANAAGKPADWRQLLKAGGFIESDSSWVPDSLLASGSNDQIYEFCVDFLQIPDTGENADLRSGYDRFFRLKASGYAAVLDGLDDFLKSLQTSGLLLGVATMDDESNALQTLEALGCQNRFDFICGADSGFGVKPQPGMVKAFCKSTGLKPHQVMMVGDSPRDLAMGRAAGVGMNVGVLTGTTTRADLEELADVVLDDISGIAELLA